MNLKKRYISIIKILFLGTLAFPFMSLVAGTAGLTGVYKGEYKITVRAHPAGHTLGYGVRKVPWTWDFDKDEVVVKGTTLSVGFNYALHDLDNFDKEKDILNFVDNGDGTYTVSHQFQIYHPGLGNPRANTSTTFEITQTGEGLDIKTIDIEKGGGKDGILGTQIVGVFPLTIEPSLMGTARIEGSDQNNDGIPDEKAIELGLDPAKNDTDGDGISDAEEIGDDIDNPKDTDGDGVIDALEPGDTANQSNFVKEIELLTGDTISLKAQENINLSGVSVDSMKVEIPDNAGIEDLVTKDSTLGQPGLDYALGNLSFTVILNTSKKAANSSDASTKTTVELSLSSDLPEKLLVYTKEYESQEYTLLDTASWEQIDSKTIQITLEDANKRDLDGKENGKVTTSIALAKNTLGQGEKKDESAGGAGIYLLALLLSLGLFSKTSLLFKKR